MAKLPSRRELADRINELERDLKIVTAAAAAGYGTRALGGAGIASRIGGAAAGPIARASPGLALADLIIRQEERLATGVEMRARSEGLPIAGRPAVSKPKRKTSKFSKAVGAGMKIAKASTSYGKKGVLSSPKKAFSAVTKTASAINKGRKVAKSGIKRKLGLAMRKILK
jgi:hypothetical protein